MTFSYPRDGLLKQNKRGKTETSSDECQNDWVEQINRNLFTPFDMICIHKGGGKIGDVMVSSTTNNTTMLQIILLLQILSKQ